jgi:hypothetical protein
MWTTENRYRCNRDKLCYASDTGSTYVSPLNPRAQRSGGKRTVSTRDAANAVM